MFKETWKMEDMRPMLKMGIVIFLTCVMLAIYVGLKEFGVINTPWTIKSLPTIGILTVALTILGFVMKIVYSIGGLTKEFKIVKNTVKKNVKNIIEMKNDIIDIKGEIKLVNQRVNILESNINRRVDTLESSLNQKFNHLESNMNERLNRIETLLGA